MGFAIDFSHLKEPCDKVSYRMARENKALQRKSLGTSTQSSPYTRRPNERGDIGSLSPSPTASLSSDKENRRTGEPKLRQKGTSASMAPPQQTTPEDPARPNKKRKLVESEPPNASQAAYQKQLAQAEDTRYYDPNQSMEERRAVRKEYRELARDLTGKCLAPMLF